MQIFLCIRAMKVDRMLERRFLYLFRFSTTFSVVSFRVFFFIGIPCMRCVVPQSSVWQRSNHMLHDMTLRLYFRYILKFSCNFPCFVADHRFSFPSLLPREFSDVYAMCQECRLIECSIYFDGFEMDFFLRSCCYVNVL